MRVLLIPIGSHGDVHPFIGLGRGLQARGHQVTVITNGLFGPLVRRSGMDFVELGSEADFRDILKNPDAWHPRRGVKVLWPKMMELLRPLYAILEKQFVPGETVAAAGTLAFAARIAQDRLGLPLASVHLQPSMLRSDYEQPRLAGVPLATWMPRWWKRTMWWVGDRLVIDPLCTPAINGFRAELGLPPVRRVLAEWIHSPQRVLGLWPDWFGPPQPDWPSQLRLTGFPLYDEHHGEPLPAAAEEFLAQGAKPIVFTPGSAMCQGHEFFAASVEACRRMGRRGILLTRFREQVPAALPPEVRHFDFIPFSQLLPRAAALVHHGGVGTSAQALAAGVPQLVMPLAFDQPDNAARLRRLGVGAELPPKRYRAPAVAAALDRLLTSPEVAANCHEVAGRFGQTDAIGDACRLIEELADLAPAPLASTSPSTRAATRGS